MEEEIPESADNPKAALASFIEELETYYYSWYDQATTRNYYAWFAAQAVSLLSGFATALIAALITTEQLKSWSVGRTLLVVLPVLGSLASTYLVQTRVAELEALREAGRQTIQGLANEARVDFAAAVSPEEYSAIHRNLVAQVADLEREQSLGFQRIIPKQLWFKLHNASPTKRKNEPSSRT